MQLFHLPFNLYHERLKLTSLATDSATKATIVWFEIFLSELSKAIREFCDLNSQSETIGGTHQYGKLVQFLNNMRYNFLFVNKMILKLVNQTCWCKRAVLLINVK